MKQLTTLLLVLVAFASQAQTTCVDPLACNFTEFGECIYVDENGDLCVVEGCNIEGACNYDPEADLNDGSCDFESCLGCTDETACNFDSEAVYLDNSCIYYVDCNGTCGGDWIQDECGNCYAPSSGLSDEIEFAFSGEIESWIVPENVDSLKITVAGASGGGQGGDGAILSGVFEVVAGTELSILVGEQGGTWTEGTRVGGGGGTFVVMGNSPLIIAGGGGGGANQSGEHSNASLSESGNPGNTSYGGSWVSQGGDAGNGALELSSCAGNGGGFYTDGQSSGCCSGAQGFAFLSGGEGGIGCAYGVGGYGGGGGPGNHGAGGGGGYSGGGASYHHPSSAGGGGSFNVGSQKTGVVGNSGPGWCLLELFQSTAPECELGCTTLQACNYNEDATNDDGTCDYCFCGPGTEYSVEAGQCLVVEGCTDFNDDGCTGTQDLLHLLSNFGNCDE